jgi:hypothetical protein
MFFEQICDQARFLKPLLHTQKAYKKNIGQLLIFALAIEANA